MFAAGSTTKTSTAILLLQMEERGILSLDDSIVKHANPYLNAISNGTSDLLRLFGPKIQGVTLRQLLQMSAGIQEYDSVYVRTYQNAHRLEDLTPMWIFDNMNRTFLCDPGTCGRYSSTNYVLLGLVAARYSHARNWDKLNQGSWMDVVPSSMREKAPGGSFNKMYYGVHGPLSAFTTAVENQGMHTTLHGYQYVGLGPAVYGCNTSSDLTYKSCAALDVYTMSSTQGWTCGNLMTTPTSVVDFFWALLGPYRQRYNLLSDASFAALLDFKIQAYFSDGPPFGYGLGVMNFTSMSWGFEKHGLFYGHNGLTYGFGSQSGVNYKYNFSVSWVNSAEVWMGPDASGEAVYDALVRAVAQYR